MSGVPASLNGGVNIQHFTVAQQEAAAAAAAASSINAMSPTAGKTQIRFLIPADETFETLSPKTMTAQIDEAVAAVRDVVAKMKFACPALVYIAGPVAAPVARRIASAEPYGAIFQVKAPGFVDPIVVSYPPASSIPVNTPPASMEISLLYEAPRAGGSDDDESKDPQTVVFWMTMNPRISVSDVPEMLDKLAGDDAKMRVRSFYRCLLTPPYGAQFMNDGNADVLIHQALALGDKILAVAKETRATRIGLISGLPTALTMAVGLRLKRSLLGPITAVDFKLNADGYVCVQ